MSRTITASLFTLIFTLLITVPTVLFIVEDTVDVSILFDVNEEENKEKESNKTLELIVIETKDESHFILSYKTNKKSSYYVKNYTTFSLENFSPPPEYS
jgi:ferric iron reductase protein FhuF